MPRALILGAFLTSLYYFFVYDNGDIQLKAIAATKADLATQKKTLTDVTAKLDRAQEYQRSAAEMGEALNKLLSYIPENFRVQDFMKTVSEEAKIAGLNIINISESRNTEATKSPDFEALGVSVDLQGTFAQEMTFLANLTKQKQIFLIDRFSLDGDASIRNSTNNSGEQEAPMLAFKGEIKAYRYVGKKKS